MAVVPLPPAKWTVGPAHAAGIFLALAVFHTWPLLAPPWRQAMTHHADVQLNAWIVAWIAHALITDPRRLFDGNIFWPEPATIAYSDPLIVPSLVVAPVLWLGGSPVLAFNLTDVIGLVVTAWATWWVVRRWTGSAAAGLVAGALVAFNVHTLTRLAHLAATHAWGLPLAWYFADALVERPRWTTAAALALVVALTAATSFYLLAFVGLIIGVVVVTGARQWRGAIAAAVASIAGLVLALPVFLPYLGLHRGGAARPMEMVEQFSASWSGYLSSTSRLHAGWTRPFFTTDVNVFFAGVVALGLAAIGLTVASRGDRASKRRAMAFVLLAGFAVLLSFGPATSLYQWLYHVLPPLQGLRAAARFGFVFLVVVALAAGLAVAALERRFPNRFGLVTVALVAAVTAEAWSGPVRTTSFDGVPPIYEHLAQATEPVRLVEVPFYPPELIFENGEYVLNATAHWQPLANGYSGYTPDSYRVRTGSFWFFPEPWAIEAIKRDGMTHVMVHLERFTPTERVAIAETIRTRSDMRLVASDTRGHRLYRLRED
jgi:hypothetical protein